MWTMNIISALHSTSSVVYYLMVVIIRVLEPQWVAVKVRNMLLEASKRYEDEENV